MDDGNTTADSLDVVGETGMDSDVVHEAAVDSEGVTDDVRGRLEHFPRRRGRQSIQCLPAFTQAQLRHLPLPLHRQQGGITLTTSLKGESLLFHQLHGSFMQM